MRRQQFAVWIGALLLPGALQVLHADVLDLICNHCAPGTGGYAGGPAPLTYGLFPIQGMSWGPYNSPHIIFGSLQLTTGNLTGSSPAGWSFGGGGSFVLTGSINIFTGGALQEVLSSRPLLSGTVLSADVPTRGFGTGFGKLTVDIDVTADHDALNLLALPDTEYIGTFATMFEPTQQPYPVPPAAFQITQTHEGAIALDPVPEPSSLALLLAAAGTALFSWRFAGRRR